MLSEETLSYKTRVASRTVCLRCQRDNVKPPHPHRACYDPVLKAWVEICLGCEMVEYADSELKKQERVYGSPLTPTTPNTR